MLAWILAFTGLLALAERALAQGTDMPPVHIASPAPDAPLQGRVSIIGSTASAEFRGWSLEFGYMDDPTNTWFLIAESDQVIESGTLVEWDTTTITDGDYTLRLTVYHSPNNVTDQRIPVRVRNYTPIETATPPPSMPNATPAPEHIPAKTLLAERSAIPRTPLPTNPAELTPDDIAGGMRSGAMFVLGIFILLAGYLYFRQLARR